MEEGLIIFLIDKRLEEKATFDIKVRDDVYGSDHLPIELIMAPLFSGCFMV